MYSVISAAARDGRWEGGIMELETSAIKRLALAGIVAATPTMWGLPATAAPWQSEHFTVPQARCHPSCAKDPFPLGQGDDYAFVVLNVPDSLNANVTFHCAPGPECQLNPG